MTLGQRLYEMRRSKGLSQEQVADVLGVTRQTVSKWETDQTTPDFDKILPLCELYNITTDELLKGESRQDNAQEYSTHNTDYNNSTNTNTYYYDQNQYETYQTDTAPTAEEKALYENGRKKSALLMAASICLYIISVIPFFIFDNEKIMLPAFFTIIAVATMMIVFAALSRPKRIKRTQQQTREDRLYKQITSILSGIILVIYMLISFATGAWNITWLLWVIYAILCQIIKLVFLLKGSEINDEE